MYISTQVPKSFSKPMQEILLDSMQCVAWGMGGGTPTAETSSSAATRAHCLLAHRPHTVGGSLIFRNKMQNFIRKYVQETLLDSMQCVARGMGEDAPTSETNSSGVARSYFWLSHSIHTVGSSL